jgi:hypothetical protein
LPQNWLAGWNVGMKLEAVDKQNASLVCVATVGNILTSDGRILIHFDGWEIEYDYWVKPDSPYIRPKGWCDQSGVTLNKPKGKDVFIENNINLEEEKKSFIIIQIILLYF